jgi:hypothetical protein
MPSDPSAAPEERETGLPRGDRTQDRRAAASVYLDLWERNLSFVAVHGPLPARPAR